jgi:hypothetical protein
LYNLWHFYTASNPDARAIYKQAFNASDSFYQFAAETHEIKTRPLIRLISYVSAGEPFSWTDGGYGPANGFEMLEIPQGLNQKLVRSVYAVQVRGDSMFP